jgi:hypothetical protein
MRLQKIVWVMLTVFAIVSCSTSQHLKSENGVLEGTIYSIGNDPFSKLGLETADGTMYILKCSKEIEKDLYAKQGKILKVYYERIDQTPEGLTLKVEKTEYPLFKK